MPVHPAHQFPCGVLLHFGERTCEAVRNPDARKGLDHQFRGLAHFRRFYLCDEPAACRLASVEVGEKVCCSLVTDHEGITLIALRAHSSYRIQKGLLVKYMGAFSMMGNARGGGDSQLKGAGMLIFSLTGVGNIFSYQRNV